ncbi:MAG: hypothetical protein AAF385_10540 [Pseudomonadota bacterium]
MDELSLNTIASWAEIIGAGSIVTGLIFGWFQIKHFRQQQRDAVAINLMQTFYSDNLASAIALLQPIEDGVTLKELKAMGTEYTKAAITIATSFETMGLLVYKNIATMDLVIDLAGGIVTTMSRKLRVWQNDMREAQQQPSWGEWFEWLGDRASAVKDNQEPAHIRHNS